jgi:hypothetical protein
LRQHRVRPRDLLLLVWLQNVSLAALEIPGLVVGLGPYVWGREDRGVREEADRPEPLGALDRQAACSRARPVSVVR